MAKTTLKIEGEYRCKESKDTCIIKDFKTELKLDVPAGANLQHEAKKEGRLLNHVRKNVDSKCVSIRQFRVKRDISGVKIEAGLAFEDVPTMKRADLEAFIEQEELNINPADYKTKTKLAEAIIALVQGEAEVEDSDEGEQADEEAVYSDEGKRDLMGVDEELDDRGLPVEELPVEE
mgnify:CR=1 FL=1